MAKILVIEDEASIADFVRRGLTLSGHEVAVAVNGGEGLRMAASLGPDLVVLDLILPDADGVSVCRSLRSSSDAGIVMLTARNLVGDRVRGLEAGADDYLPKPFAFDELLARIHSVLRRRSPQSREVITVADLVIDLERREVTRAGVQIDLTNREFELLGLLAENVERPLNKDYIVERLWGADMQGESDPARVYVSYLRRKLNAGGGPDLIHTLRGYGYVLREPRGNSVAR